MHVIECEVPSSSALSQDLIRSAYFHDSYRVKLARPGLSIVEIFFALFGHTPFWMKALLITRNAIARRFELEAPTTAEILHPVMRASYHVGDKIGPWPIYFIGEDEIVAGRNNRHLDFRLSVLRVKNADTEASSSRRSARCTISQARSICSSSCSSTGPALTQLAQNRGRFSIPQKSVRVRSMAYVARTPDLMM